VEDSGGTFYSVGKYTASGTRIWTTRFATGYNTDGWGLAVDPTNGFIYVAGKTNTDGGQEKSTLTKIASDGGAVEWSKTYAFGIGINSNSQVVDVASDGNPVMVGYVSNGTDDYVATTKVDAEDGSIIWSKKLDGQADELAYGMAVGPAGEVVSVGYMAQLDVTVSRSVTPLTGSTTDVLVINRSDLSGDTLTASWVVAGTGITGTASIAQINIYNALTGTVQQGSGASFMITDASPNPGYTFMGAANGGLNYLPDHKIKILGTDLGGTTPENDAIITVTSVSTGGVIVGATVEGTAGAVAPVEGWTVTGTNYQTGSGLSFDFIGDSNNTYTEHTTSIFAAGTNYVNGDVVVIPGTQLGGTSPANDLTAVVSATDGAVTTFNSFSGTQQTTTYRISVIESVDFSGPGTWTLSGTTVDTDNRMLVVKYNSAGAIQWQKAILFDAGLDSTGADADIDSEGNVYVCGQYEVNDPTLSGICMNLVKFNSAGVKQWSRRVEGDCGSIATSIVVGADDKLYLSGSLFTTTVPNPGPGDPIDISCVVAKYNLDGTVVWQRLLDNIDTLSVSGSDFLSSQGGGSNLAVKQDYVALAGGFGTDPGDVRALIAQLPAAGDLFAVGAWDFKASSLTGILDTGASDITVVDANKTDTDNVSNIIVVTVTPTVDSSDFLIGTLYSAPGSNNSLVNNGNQLVLESTGTLTLPSGGTISEGYVTSNPTIQLTPASPSVASQKLVIKGGGSYPNTENGIYLSTYTITWAVSDTVEFYVYDPTRANETLYWWIVPEGSGISTTMSGTVALDGIGDGTFTFTLDSDAYEFRVRVSPEEDNYDPESIGVESVLINGDEPTFEGEHHLHLTTGNLEVTSIFLGTDNHNVRTTVDGGIQVTTGGQFNICTIDNAGSGYASGDPVPAQTTGGTGTGMTADFGYGISGQLVSVSVNNPGTGYTNGDVITVGGGTGTFVLTRYNALANQGNSNSFQSAWNFSADGATTLPQGGVISETEVNSSHSILLTPKVQSGENPNMAVRIYPTFTDDDHIHITAGNPATVDLFLGDDIQYVKLEADGGNVVISADDPVGIKWTFGTDGTLTLPKNSSVGEVTPATGAAKNVIVIQSASSILNTSFASLPPAPINNYNVPGTGIVVNVTWNTNGEDYHAPAFVVVDGGTGHTGGGESGGGDVLTVPYVDMGISGGGNWTWYVVDIASDVVLTAGLESWTFGGNGDTEFPNNVSIISGGASYRNITGDNGISLSQIGNGNDGSSNLLWYGATQSAKIQLNRYGAGNLAKVIISAEGTGGIKTWTFDETGTTTLPGTVVNSTATTPTTTGIPNNFTLSTGNNTNLTPGNYSNILVGFTGKNLLLGVQVSSEHNITIYGPLTATPATFIIGDSAVISGDLIGGATPADDLTITVDSLDLVAIDLTKTINKLADGDYVLGDGVEGQIMYLVAQNGVVPTNVSVLVANSRNIGEATLLPFRVYDYSDDSYYDNIGGFCTLIFTDGAWQQTGGAWEIIT
jgi:hypothetical protein